VTKPVMEMRDSLEPPLLEVRNATKVYGRGLLSGRGQVTALRGCSLTVQGNPATITAVAGESGSGKSTLAGAILGFVRLDEGSVRVRGRDVATLMRHERLDYRRQVQAVFQDPYAVFNPFYRAGHIFDLVVRRFGIAENRRAARERIEEALGLVGLRGEEVLDKYPHQLSGGQRQRMMVARAYLVKPRLIVADEPVSMVDASLRSMILDVMLRLRDAAGISFVYITHDLSTAFQVADDIHILYRGVRVESGPVAQVLSRPAHPYTQLLLDSVPLPDPSQRWTDEVRGSWEDEGEIPEAGCCFYGRCKERTETCRVRAPETVRLDANAHSVACHARQGKSGAAADATGAAHGALS
jgi:oligopeptide/dipeptide ABC transporter ATP-binding protein